MTVEAKPKMHVDSYRGDAGRDKMRFTTPRNFRFTNTTDERIQEALVRNSIMESSPNRPCLTMETSEEIMNLRPREEHKELSRAHFRFKPAI